MANYKFSTTLLGHIDDDLVDDQADVIFQWAYISFC